MAYTLYQLTRQVFQQRVNVKEELQEEALQGLPSSSTSPEERIQPQSLCFSFPPEVTSTAKQFNILLILPEIV